MYYLIVQGPCSLGRLGIKVPIGPFVEDRLTGHIILQGLGYKAQDKAFGRLAGL